MNWIATFMLLGPVSSQISSDTTYVYILKPGDTIAKILQRYELPITTIKDIILSLRNKVNLSKCRVGDKVYITKSNDKFVSLKYEHPKSTWCMDSLMRVFQLEEIAKFIYLQGAIKKGSLWDDVISVGGTPQLVSQFANEVFPWDIDFNTQLQKGDEFEILVIGKYIEDRFIGYDKIIFARYMSKKKEFIGIYYSGSEAGYYNLEGNSLRRAFLKSPIRYFRISSGFSHSRLHPILRKRIPHLGVDYAAPTGTPVSSIGRGKVIFAGWKKGFGNQVVIQHPNGFKSYYAHLARLNKMVHKGKQVTQGEVIGWVGSTGLSTGPHLDFRIQQRNTWVNPLKIVSPPDEPLKGKRLEYYKDYINKLFTLLEGLNTVKKSSTLITHL